MILIIFYTLFISVIEARASAVCEDSFAQLAVKPVVNRAGAVVRDLRPIDKNFLNAAIREKKEAQYIVDQDGEIFLLDEGKELTKDTLWIIRKSDSVESPAHIVVESGIINSDNKGRIILNPSFNIDSARVEADEAFKQLQLENSIVKLAKSSKESSTRVLDCANILAKQVSVKSTFWDRLIGDNLVVASAFAVTEMAGAKRLQSTDGQQVIAADMLGTNIYSATSALVGSYLVNTQKSLPISLITRAGMGLGMIEVQRGIYQVTLDKNPEDRANAIAAFDQAYLFARLPVAHYTDKFIMKQLPELLFDSCKKGGKLSVIITPRSVRIMERYGMAILYFGLRSAIIGE